MPVATISSNSHAINPPRWAIGQVYNAFDVESNALYHRSLELTYGCTIQVQQLVTALHERAAELSLTVGLGPINITPNQRGWPEFPLVNSPELRRLLFLALDLAEAQPPHPRKITVPILALSTALAWRRLTIDELTSHAIQLQLVIPTCIESDSSLFRCVIPATSMSNVTIISSSTRGSTNSTVQLPPPKIEDLITGWLALQTITNADELSHESSTLGMAVSRF